MKSSEHSSTKENQAEGSKSVKQSADEKKKTTRFKKLFLLFLIGLFLLLLVGGIGYYFIQPEPGRTSLLVMGVAGEDRAGGDLTDTMIFASVDHQSGQILILSLPRDLWITPLRTKLNAVYHYQGVQGAQEAVEEILSQPIDHYLLVDFDVFTQLIDVLGGVEVEVLKSFDDHRYPIPGKEEDLCGRDPDFGCRYEYLRFEAGRQLMDGQRALKYVRSRFAEGEEGTDFARNQRQQQLLLAVKNKLLSSEVILSPGKVKKLVEVVSANIKTSVTRKDYWNLCEVLFGFRSDRLKMEVLNGGYLTSPPPSQAKYDGQWVLVPSSGSWREIQDHVQKLL